MTLQPLDYHQRTLEVLQAVEPELWNFFSKAETEREYLEDLRQSLLKSTYRLPEDHSLYALARQASEALGLSVPFLLYQGAADSPNAQICLHPEEVHIVFLGDILERLGETEILAVLGHEFAHHHLMTIEDARHSIAGRVLNATLQEDPHPSQIEVARRHQLYTEIYCDRGSLVVTKDLHASISSLVKIENMIAEVDSASYLKQAAEIFDRDKSLTSSATTHPEIFIRARSMDLWERGLPEKIENMIAGQPHLDHLDLLDQQELTRETITLIHELLEPEWFRTDVTLSHARQFHPSYEWEAPKAERTRSSRLDHDSIDKFYAYLLLDFATVDKELDDAPLIQCLKIAQRLDIGSTFKKIAMRELQMKSRQWKFLEEEVKKAQ